MTAQETSVANFFSTTLTAGVTNSDLTFPVDSIGSLTSPCLIIIDPDNEAKREVIRADGTWGVSSFVASTLARRGLEGSAAGAQAHDVNTSVEVRPLSQHIQDIHDRIDVNAAGIATNVTDIATNATNIATNAADIITYSDHGNLSGLADDDHTQYSRADGTRAFTGEVSGITPTTDPALATKGYTDGLVEAHYHDGTLAPILLFPQVIGAALTDDTGLLDTPSQWGVQELNFPDANGLTVDVICQVSGGVQYNQATASRRRGRVYLEVSFDGGTVWSRSPGNLVEVDGNTQRVSGISHHFFVSGTATGTVQVRTLLEQVQLGTSNDVDFRDGYMTATVVHTQPV